MRAATHTLTVELEKMEPADSADALHRVAEMVAESHPAGPIYDLNGNTVGRWKRGKA